MFFQNRNVYPSNVWIITVIAFNSVGLLRNNLFFATRSGRESDWTSARLPKILDERPRPSQCSTGTCSTFSSSFFFMLSSHPFSWFLFLQFLGQIWWADQQTHHCHRQRPLSFVSISIRCHPRHQHSPIVHRRHLGGCLRQCRWQCGQRHQNQYPCGGLHHLSRPVETLRVSRHPPGTSALLWHGQCGLPMASGSTLHRHRWFSGGHDEWIGRGFHHRVRFWGR